MPIPQRLLTAAPPTLRTRAFRWKPPIILQAPRSVTDTFYYTFGVPFLYTAANWGSVAWYFEVYMKATSGTALARLVDANGLALASSEVSTTNLQTYVRLRSAALTLVDGSTYQPQFGNKDMGAGAFRGAKLIAV